MSKTGSEIERDFFQIVHDSPLSQEIRGKVYRKGMRPLDSKEEDIVVKHVTTTDKQVQKGLVVVNIYIPNINDGSKCTIKDVPRCEKFERLAYDMFTNLQIPEYDFWLDGVPYSNEVEGIDQHFVHVRIRFKRSTF